MENVLVNTPTTNDFSAASNTHSVLPHGVKISYKLAFPKTWNKPLKDCYLVIPRIDKNRRFRVIGDPAPVPTDHCPTEWNYNVMIGDSDG